MINTPQEHRSWWDTLTQRRDFYDAINAPIDDVVQAIAGLAHKRRLVDGISTHVTIIPDETGSTFLIRLRENLGVMVIATGHVWPKDATHCHWEGHIRYSLNAILMRVIFMILMGGAGIYLSVLSLMAGNWQGLLFSCLYGLITLFIASFDSIQRRGLRRRLAKILEQFGSSTSTAIP